LLTPRSEERWKVERVRAVVRGLREVLIGVDVGVDEESDGKKKGTVNGDEGRLGRRQTKLKPSTPGNGNGERKKEKWRGRDLDNRNIDTKTGTNVDGNNSSSNASGSRNGDVGSFVSKGCSV
jgi:hypothetical protein